MPLPITSQPLPRMWPASGAVFGAGHGGCVAQASTTPTWRKRSVGVAAFDLMDDLAGVVSQPHQPGAQQGEPGIGDRLHRRPPAMRGMTTGQRLPTAGVRRHGDASIFGLWAAADDGEGHGVRTRRLGLGARLDPVLQRHSSAVGLPWSRLVVLDLRAIQVEEAAQFADQLVVLVDPQVDQRMPLGAIDDQGRRMLAAMLAAGITTGLQRQPSAAPRDHRPSSP